MSVYVGVVLIALLALACWVLANYWRDNRILKMDLKSSENRLALAYDVSDRYKDRVIALNHSVTMFTREQWYSQINPLPVHTMVTTSVLLAAEWGGVRLGKSPIDAGCSGLLLYSPAGVLFVLYPTELGGQLAHLPEAATWDWHGAKHRLICESEDQVVADLMVYARHRESERSTTASRGGEKECQTGA